MATEQTAQGQAAAPETKETTAIVTRTWTDAPTSANVKATINGHDWQITIRADTFAELSKRIPAVNAWLDEHGGKGNGKTRPQLVQFAPIPPGAQSTPVPPPPPAQPAAQQGGEAVCQMIEVGLSFKNKKLQLKFHCEGMDNPLTYTKSAQEMAALIAPLGFTQAQIVQGKYLPTSAIVTWVPNTASDGKTYKNVTAVRVA
jgi:hypothetical protein